MAAQQTAVYAIFAVKTPLFRWIKYEQIVEGDFTRFSKPHITLLQMQVRLEHQGALWYELQQTSSFRR